jgi:hypothetical protein
MRAEADHDDREQQVGGSGGVEGDRDDDCENDKGREEDRGGRREAHQVLIPAIVAQRRSLPGVRATPSPHVASIVGSARMLDGPSPSCIGLRHRWAGG